VGGGRISSEKEIKGGEKKEKKKSVSKGNSAVTIPGRQSRTGVRGRRKFATLAISLTIAPSRRWKR